MTVLRPPSSLRRTKETESAQAGPNETRLAGAPTPPGDLLREPASQDWPLVYLERLARCPEVGDRQEVADLAALETTEWWRASQLRYISGRKRLREVLAEDRCALEHWHG